MERKRGNGVQGHAQGVSDEATAARAVAASSSISVTDYGQHEWDGLLKISCDGIHDDNKEEWGKRRTFVYPTEMGNSIEAPAAA
ncbi:unnamed protein product [Heligmosomoides polygyrus]|uniref:Reverse transcriptase n=1 Tax=Heligmosomoides polygyrus TaxID=6339 RepID=A0A183G3R9_HELPZ|nr:unnamed protein product [Heligmosomoides polygyrus]